jgi:hypothetical protein
MNLPELSGFSLVGGTALALRYGHRISIDLDLFSSENFDIYLIIKVLSDNFPTFQIHSTTNVGIFGFINDVKVDFVKYHYFPVIAPVEVEKENNFRFHAH